MPWPTNFIFGTHLGQVWVWRSWDFGQG